jgi:hypothetical protein
VEIMRDKKNDKNTAVDRLMDALVEDILRSTDDEILADAREHGEDPEKIAAVGRVQFEKAVALAAKGRLAAARTAVAHDQSASRSVVSLNAAAARHRLNRVLSRDPNIAERLTLAARKGKDEELSDEDVRGMLEDLQELGIVSGEGDEP